MTTKNYPVLSIVLYVLAGLLGIYTIWAAYYHYSSISTMVSMGQVVISGNEFELVSFLMANIAQYPLFAVILFSLGRIMQPGSSADEYLDAEDWDDELDEDELEHREQSQE
ncbi:MAG: hypothetical protein ACNA8H_00910 [Anaerolineales bacterium]